MRWIIAAAILLSANIQTLATTYIYVGQPFTDFTYYNYGSYLNDGACNASTCTSITGFVKFNFDTSHFSGTLQLSAGDTANLSGGIPAPVYTATDFPYPSFTYWFNSPQNTYGYTSELIGFLKLSNGAIVDWSLSGGAGQVGCGGGPGCAAGGAGVYTSPTWDYSSVTGYLVTVSASNSGGGIWTEQIAPAVPEPSTWAMLLIGFAGIGFIAYRRRQKLYPLAAPC